MLQVNRGQIVEEIHEKLIEAKRAEITRLVVQYTGSKVQSGPFQGMTLQLESAWGDGDVLTKLLGTYEQELHLALRHFAGKQYGAVVNVGCAEGYYAVGLSRHFSSIPAFAFDLDEKARQLCRLAAHANGMSEQVMVNGGCSSDDLKRLAAEYKPILGIIDCEAHELDLLPEEVISGSLMTSDFIIECHDFITPGITGKLRERFAKTHIVINVRSGARDPNAIPLLSQLKDSDRWLVMSEGRPCTMNWLVCEAYSRA